MRSTNSYSPFMERIMRDQRRIATSDITQISDQFISEADAKYLDRPACPEERRRKGNSLPRVQQQVNSLIAVDLDPCHRIVLSDLSADFINIRSTKELKPRRPKQNKWLRW